MKMKVKIETTLYLSDHEIEAMKAYMEDLGIEDETVREFVKSNCAGWANGFITETATNYGKYAE
jgi:hypothetical protein